MIFRRTSLNVYDEYGGLNGISSRPRTDCAKRGRT